MISTYKDLANWLSENKALEIYKDEADKLCRDIMRVHGINMLIKMKLGGKQKLLKAITLNIWDGEATYHILNQLWNKLDAIDDMRQLFS